MSTKFLKASAVGGDVSVSLPNGDRPYDYEIHSIYVQYVSKGPPAGQRQIRVTLEDDEGDIVQITGGDTQPVNTTRHYCAYPDAVLERVPNGDDIQWLPWSPVALARGGSTIRAKNVAQATPNDEVRIFVQYDNSINNRST